MSSKTPTKGKQRRQRTLSRTSAARASRDRAIAAALAAARQQAGISQRELAVRLSRVPSFVGKIELCSRQLKVSELLDYADALDTDAVNLLREITVLANTP